MNKVAKFDKVSRMTILFAGLVAGFFVATTAIGETENSGVVDLEEVGTTNGSPREVLNGGIFTHGLGDSRYYDYKADNLQIFSLKNLSKLTTALVDGELFSNRDDAGPRVDISQFDQARPFLADFNLIALPEVAEAVKAHYQQYPEFVWVTGGRINSKAIRAMEVLSNADKYGLVPAEYDVLVSTENINSPKLDDKLKRLIETEFVLSTKVLTYVLDGTRGRINPNEISRYHDLPRKKVDLTGILAKLAKTYDVEEVLEGVHPDNEYFRILVGELERLRKSQPTRVEPVRISIRDSIRPGNSDDELPKIISAMHRLGSPSLISAHVNTFRTYEGTTTLTSDLELLVRDFQQEFNLEPDGIIGRKTVRALHLANNSDNVDKVRFALERLRWLPSDLGSNRVFVNQPAFEAYYIEDGVQTLSMRVVVGTKRSQTSFFQDEIERVVFNPFWSVPRNIVANEYAPKLIADPTYFDSRGFEVIAKNGKQIPATAVNWQRVAERKTSVRVRQVPGKFNALGELKIMFPNVHAIYMHDTPEKNLFEREYRAFSHGCIRLQHPREMAAAILGTDTEYVAGMIEKYRSKSEPVSGRLPVYIAYFTAWPDNNGSISFYEDIYDRDNYLRIAELKTAAARQDF